MKLQPVRGTHDIAGDEARLMERIVSTARTLGTCWGFEEVATPIFEFTDVFKRTLGDTSDVVTKEMYSFDDRGGDNLTLRPEFTAGIARAFINGSFGQTLPLKLFSHGPLFRYERPQKGRYRQFHQINFEVLGSHEPAMDVEIISLGFTILESLGLKDKVTLQLNSLGDQESRLAYRAALVDYLEQHRSHLSQESIERLTKNPLRILDSKDENDKKIVANAPSPYDFFTETARDFLSQVEAGLDVLGISHTRNPLIVRGLDYYNHTVFEFTTTHLGAQGTVLAGGRYDGLIAQMGGNATPAVGFAAGCERLSLLMEAPEKPGTRLALMAIDEKAEAHVAKLGYEWRKSGIAIEMIHGDKLGKKLKKAANKAMTHALMVGEAEMGKLVIIKNLDSGAQTETPEAEILYTLKKL